VSGTLALGWPADLGEHGGRGRRGPRGTAIGVSLALFAAGGIIASFWVWIAADMGVYWEHKAGPAAVAAVEELSAEISAPQSGQDTSAGKAVP